MNPSAKSKPEKEIICLGSVKPNPTETSKSMHQNSKAQMQSTPKTREVVFPEVQTPEVAPYRSQNSTRTKNQETDRKGRKIPEACQQKLPATSQVHRNQKSKTVKHRYLDSPGNDTPQNPRPSLRPHRNTEVDTV